MPMSRVVGMLVVLVGLLFTVGLSADEKSSKKSTLPTNWSKLGLSEEQKDQIKKIRGDAKTKIDDLKDQIKALEKQETLAMFKVLTEGQRAKLRKISTEKIPDEASLNDKKELPKEK
jgi:hypothetical protein